MLRVGCSNDNCIHNKNGFCNFDGCINVGDEFYCGCDEYLSYLNTPEYNERYFIARAEKEELPRHRVEKYGRKICFKGFIFYTQNHNYEDDITNYLVTEERTGYYCGTINDLQKPELWQKFVENIKSIPSVMDLPLAVMRDGEYVIQEADNE